MNSGKGAIHKWHQLRGMGWPTPKKGKLCVIGTNGREVVKNPKIFGDVICEGPIRPDPAQQHFMKNWLKIRERQQTGVRIMDEYWRPKNILLNKDESGESFCILETLLCQVQFGPPWQLWTKRKQFEVDVILILMPSLRLQNRSKLSAYRTPSARISGVDPREEISATADNRNRYHGKIRGTPIIFIKDKG